MSRNGNFRHVDASVAQRIVALRAEGASWRRIGRELGMSTDLAERVYADATSVSGEVDE